jgi:GntR family transcriptional regulator/MocR family aminotransferase
MRRLYEARRGVLAGALERRLGDRIAFSLPVGGMALWAHFPGTDVEALAARCAERGLVFQTAKRFTFDGKKRPFARLGYAAETEARLERAVEILAGALDRAR